MRASTILSMIAGIIAAVVPHGGVAAQVSVVGGSIHEAKAIAGTEYHGTLLIRNDDAAPQHIRIYLTDYSFSAEGTSSFATAGSSPRSNAAWIGLSAQTAVIAPGQSASITYRVAVPGLPAGATDGSYWSMAMIEAQTPDVAVAARTRGVSLQTVTRQGVQIVTHVGTSAAASIAFSNVEVTRGPTGAEIRFDAANVGSRARRLGLSVDLYRADGAFVGKYAKSRGLVYPGSSIRQKFALENVASGEYLAFIVADAGDDDLFAGNFKVKL